MKVEMIQYVQAGDAEVAQIGLMLSHRQSQSASRFSLMRFSSTQQ